MGEINTKKVVGSSSASVPCRNCGGKKTIKSVGQDVTCPVCRGTGQAGIVRK